MNKRIIRTFGEPTPEPASYRPNPPARPGTAREPRPRRVTPGKGKGKPTPGRADRNRTRRAARGADPETLARFANALAGIRTKHADDELLKRGLTYGKSGRVPILHYNRDEIARLKERGLH